MASSTLPKYDTMNNHALLLACKSRGLEPPKGSLRHELIKHLARDHLNKHLAGLESEDFNAVNDPNGSKREASINESYRVETHFVRLELQSLADYNREQHEKFLAQQNLAPDSAEEDQPDYDSLFEEGPEGSAENVLSNPDPLFDSVPEKDAENDPGNGRVVETGDIGEVIESSNKRAKPDHESGEEEEINTAAAKRQRLLDLGGLSEDLVNALTKDPETNDEIQPFSIPNGTIGDKLRAENLMIMELAYESSDACFSLGMLHHYKHFEEFGALLLMADNSALHVIFQCSEEGETNLIKCMAHVNKQVKEFFTLRPCCQYFSEINHYRFGHYPRDMELEGFEGEEEQPLYFYGTVEDDLEIEFPRQQPKYEVPVDPEEVEEDKANQKHTATKKDTESGDGLDSMYDADDEFEGQTDRENTLDEELEELEKELEKALEEGSGQESEESEEE
ncbi:hypothetical protein DL95DRAFT_501733 [Leptodontidium sp. 2 PMI_412]|nr:hypothetical protein DL95DRAFT_501733 [Leptodontidium sp. 2 PMI_412]